MSEPFNYRAAELYCLFIEGHERGHVDSEGRPDTEEMESCQFCAGNLTVGVDPNYGPMIS